MVCRLLLCSILLLLKKNAILLYIGFRSRKLSDKPLSYGFWSRSSSFENRYKKRMQCFIQTIAFFHLTIRILQCCNSHSFFRVSQRFFLRFLCLIYLLTRNKTVQYFLIDFYFKAVAHFLNASLIEREEIVCFHSIGHVGI